MSARQRDAQIEWTAVKVTRRMPFKRHRSHCHPHEPSRVRLDDRVRLRERDRERERRRQSKCNVISESERGKGYNLCTAHGA